MTKLEWQWAEFGQLDGASWYEVLRVPVSYTHLTLPTSDLV